MPLRKTLSIILFLLTLFSSHLVLAAVQESPPLCYIIPPKEWEVADPQILSKSVQIAFFKKKSGKFRPSINLSTESTLLSLERYLKAIQKIHERNPQNRWRRLGKAHTLAGVGELTEIDTITDLGAVRMLQLILIKGGCAYIVTAAALKEEISEHYQAFQNALRTLCITSDLISAIPQALKRDTLQQLCDELFAAWKNRFAESSFQDPQFQKDHWIPFQNSVTKDYEEMGAHGQILLLKTTQEKLVSSQLLNSSQRSTS
ncbi:MAG: hypothetical protein HYZ48_05730 [Chlamydiales bacterium]|nr:hypothetical protein [Chlamydiales bacterium]